MISLHKRAMIGHLVLASCQLATAITHEYPWSITRRVVTQSGRLATLLRRHDKAHLRGLALADNHLAAELPVILRELAGDISRVQAEMQRSPSPQPTLRDILADLQQIDQEFDGLKFDSLAGTVSADTESISLEGIAFGPFRLSVKLDELAEGLPEQFLKSEALEPNPPSSESSVTHPHISNDRICLGEGTCPISQAAQQGRLVDIFVMARSILTNYNPESPYVELGNWFGRSCYECGCSTGEEDGYSCGDCGEFLCSSCIIFCAACDDASCERCLSTCEECGKKFCASCVTVCPDCENSICKSCLDEGCSCQKEKTNDNDLSEEKTGHLQHPADPAAA